MELLRRLKLWWRPEPPRPDPVRTIAHWVPVTEQQLSDAELLSGIALWDPASFIRLEVPETRCTNRPRRGRVYS